MSKKITIFDTRYAQAGVSTTDFSKDGGFSPLDKGQNLWVKKGLLYNGPVYTERAGTVYKIVAWAMGYSNDTVVPMAVGDNGSNDGYFYSLASTTGVGTQELTTDTKDFFQFKSDAIYFDGYFYVSSKDDVGRFTNAFGSASYNWWSSIGGHSTLNIYCPHHLIEYDGKIYITDDYKLHSWDGTDSVENAFSIPSNYKITTAVVHKNKMYIFASTDYGTGKDRFVASKCFIWNKITSETEYEDDFEINDKVYSAKVHDGVLYLWCSKAFGYWNGIKFVKIMDLNPTYPVYKQMITNNSEVLMFAHNKDIIAYDGNKYSYLFSTENITALSSHRIDAIFSGYDDDIWASINNKIYKFDFEDNSGDGEGYHRFNRQDFSENVRIDRILIEFGEEMETGSDMPVTFYDENGDVRTIGDMKYSNGDRWYKDFNEVDEECASLQLRIENKTNAKPIKKITAWVTPTGDSVEE